MGAAKHLFRYLARSVNFSNTYKRGEFKLAAYSDATWGNNPDNDKSTSSYIGMLAHDPISFKVDLQRRTAQSTMEAELVEAAFTMNKAVFCFKRMAELGFEKGFICVQLYLDLQHSTSAAIVHAPLG